MRQKLVHYPTVCFNLVESSAAQSVAASIAHLAADATNWIVAQPVINRGLYLGLKWDLPGNGQHAWPDSVSMAPSCSSATGCPTGVPAEDHYDRGPPLVWEKMPIALLHLNRGMPHQFVDDALVHAGGREV